MLSKQRSQSRKNAEKQIVEPEKLARRTVDPDKSPKDTHQIVEVIEATLDEESKEIQQQVSHLTFLPMPIQNNAKINMKNRMKIKENTNNYPYQDKFKPYREIRLSLNSSKHSNSLQRNSNPSR